MEYDALIRYREYQDVIDLLDSVYLQLGFSDRASMLRLLTRAVISNPELLFDRQGTREVDQTDIITLLKDIKTDLDGRLDQLVSLVDRQQRRANQAIDQMIDEVLTTLLTDERLRECKTTEELEELYPATFWKEYTPDILDQLVEMGVVRVMPKLGGDILFWK